MRRTRATVALHVPESERRAPSRQRHTTPGSVNHRVSECVRATVEATGHAMTVGDHRNAYRTRYGEVPPAYDARLFQLVRFGILVAVDGCTSKTRYAHRDDAVPLAEVTVGEAAAVPAHEPQHDCDPQEQDDQAVDVDNGEDDAVLVLRALHRAFARLGRPISTREVADEVREVGQTVGAGHPDAVRQRLGTLATPRVRDLVIRHAPPVRRETVPTASGRPSTRWLPATAVAPINAAAPASQTEALRTVVAAACAHLGRPADVAELRLWLRVHASHPAADVLCGVQIGDLLPRVVRTDAARIAPGRVLLIAGDRATGGRARARYVDADGVGDLRDAHIRCRLLDLVTTLECATELREIAALEHRARRLHSPSLARLAVVRRDALWHAVGTLALRDHVKAKGGDPACVLTQITRLLKGTAILESWIAQLRTTARSGSRTCDVAGRRVVATRVHSKAVQRVIHDRPHAGRPGIGPVVHRVSADSAVELREIAPFLTAAALEWERPDTLATHRALTTEAGVFAAAAPVRITAPRQGAFVPRIRVDRVDALAGLYRALPVVRAPALLASATELLGRVVRDQNLVAAVRDASRPVGIGSVVQSRVADDHPAVWRAAVVALGLLCVTPVTEDWAVARTAGEYDRCAVTLAASLASLSGAVKALAVLCSDGGRTELVAARRLGLGRLMTVIG